MVSFTSFDTDFNLSGGKYIYEDKIRLMVSSCESCWKGVTPNKHS